MIQGRDLDELNNVHGPGSIREDPGDRDADTSIELVPERDG
jgi:hypothetical protein